MLFDTHMHADFSCDAKMTLPEAAAAAKAAGIGIILTEHWDRYYPTNPDQFLFDLDTYFRQNTPWRSDKVLLGLEVGMQPAAAAEDNKIIKQYPFDEIVASMHCVQGKDIYEERAYDGLSKNEAVEELLRDTLTCLELYKDFDTLGHIDYISRYMPYEDQELYYADHAALWDQVFTKLAGADKALEINTRRLDKPQAVDSLRVLAGRFRELGGRYVTLGSDAHYTEHVGRRLEAAAALAAECDLTIVYFRERQRIIAHA